MIQATTRGQVLQGVQQYGLAPGARKMIDAEEEASDKRCNMHLYNTFMIGSYNSSTEAWDCGVNAKKASSAPIVCHPPQPPAASNSPHWNSCACTPSTFACSSTFRKF